mgnify:CR=1 FL=1|tara:strand:- start:4647 stop:5105 length:459 start_codon:yes stop_codon:yes gene_type:complete
MIIECINCSKKFDVNSDLIPPEGRNLKCSSCNHVWFFQNNSSERKDVPQIAKKTVSPLKNIDKKDNIKHPKSSNTNIKSPKSQIIKYEPKSYLNFSTLLSYILVVIISFIGFIIILDTFKTPLYNYFPKLEFLLFSLFETLKDVKLFINDLI